ncbi:PHP domain-containing protein [Thermoproteota archaeon]
MDNVLFKRVSKKLRSGLSEEGMTGFDMHFHTRYSWDGMSLIPNVMKKAHKKGIGVAITDHNKIRGATACQNNRYKVPIIPGVEITCKEGTHMLMYFYSHNELREFFTKHIMPGMKTNPFAAPVTVQELLELSKDYNCINSAAHPFAPGVTGIKHLEVTTKMKKQLNQVEVINGYNTHLMNINAMIWANEINKHPTGGSDGHTTSELGGVLTFVNGTTPEEVLTAVKKNQSRVVGKEENLLKKLILAIEKEGLFIKRSKMHHKAKLLLKTQFGNEYNYIKEKVKNKRSHKIRHFRKRHVQPHAPNHNMEDLMFHNKRAEEK